MNTELPKPGSVLTKSPHSAPIPSEPRRINRTFKFWICLVATVVLIVAFSIIPPIYTLSLKVPPLSEMQRTSGVISLKPAGKTGPLTIVTRADGIREEFSCREEAGGSNLCVTAKHVGKQVDVWWFYAFTYPFEKHKYPAQMVIDGEKVRTIEKTMKAMQFAKWTALPYALLYAVIFLYSFRILIGIRKD